MRKNIIAGILLSLLSVAPSFAQSNANDVAALNQRVAQLEKQVAEISQLLEPMRAQQAADARRKVLREKFNQRNAADRAKHTQEQLREAEGLYQVANQKWGTSEATESLQAMIQKYPDINRTGCAVLYVAQMSKGDDRAKNLQDCIEKYNDCMYGDGVQVGAYARYLLMFDCRSNGDIKKADELASEIKDKFSDAVDHSGNLLVDNLKAEPK
ncbi:MAG TPA: hypothetical protein VHC44_19945 [Verrucomicrobiae bacterium]|nr:hypothetical protein [Verrucomicrobiae bacterium]